MFEKKHIKEKYNNIIFTKLRSYISFIMSHLLAMLL